MPKIVRVIPSDDYSLEIELDNHHKIIYNIKPRLEAIRFSSLSDLEKFRSVRVENDDTLVWDRLCQISISEIISLVER